MTELEDINLLTEPLNEKVHKSMATKAVPNAKKKRYGYPKASEYLLDIQKQANICSYRKKMPGLWHKRILRFSLYIQNLKAWNHVCTVPSGKIAGIPNPTSDVVKELQGKTVYLNTKPNIFFLVPYFLSFTTCNLLSI